ncbi:MAG: hypothetical protein AAFX01_05075 [Cyanobacteria bacterium J06638_28]
MINAKEIRVIGLRRTGNHAIIGWIRAQHHEYAFHVNHPPGGMNPYRFLANHYDNAEFHREARGEFTPKSLLILSYEDQDLADICCQKFEKFHDVYVGPSASRYDVLILRDPFNLMASQLKSGMASMTTGTAQRKIRVWKDYAREFLNQTQLMPHQKCCISFNQWHYDAAYREKIAGQLALNFSDVGREKVRGYGGGSSFSGRELDGQASQLNILDRWHIFQDDPDYWNLFRDDELLGYVSQIFDTATLPMQYVQ